MKIIRELTKEEACLELKTAGLRHDVCGLPYRGYAVTLSDDGKRRRFIGHRPDGKYILSEDQSRYADALRGEPFTNEGNP